MKKTLTLLLSLGLFAITSLANAATTFTTTNSSTSTVANAYYTGFRLNLDPSLANSRLTTASTPASTSIPQYVQLDSISTNIRRITAGTNTNTELFLALADSSGNVISMSDGVSQIGEVTWNFTNTTISTTENLYFYFVKDSNISTVTSDSLIAAGSSTLINYGDKSGTDSLTLIGGDNTSMSINNQNYATKLVIKTSPIPEPSTATLGLLGLGALMMRRRRQS